LRALIQRFAAVVIAKLRRFVQYYTDAHRERAMEPWEESIARASLLWLLEQVTSRFHRFPWLNPMTRAHVQEEFEKIVVILRSDWVADIHQDGASA
jgi:hypothetical protein